MLHLLNILPEQCLICHKEDAHSLDSRAYHQDNEECPISSQFSLSGHVMSKGSASEYQYLSEIWLTGLDS